MRVIDRPRLFNRRLLGLASRPLWLAVHAITGRRFQASVEYLDLGMYGGFFEAPADAVQQRLPAGFQVVARRPGWTELELWCAEYRRIDMLRPYNELAVIAPVRYSRPGEVELEARFVLHMPVTTEQARWGGVDNYGFPKTLADIRIVDRGSSKHCSVHQAGRHVLSMQVDVESTEPFEEHSTCLSVRDDGLVIASTFDLAGERSEQERAGGVSLELGPHAIADQLEQIGLRPHTGRALYIPRARARLGKGIEIGPLPAATGAVREQPASKLIFRQSAERAPSTSVR